MRRVSFSVLLSTSVLASACITTTGGDGVEETSEATGAGETGEPPVVVEDEGWWLGSYSNLEYPDRAEIMLRQWVLHEGGTATFTLYRCGQIPTTYDYTWRSTEDGRSVELESLDESLPGPRYLSVGYFNGECRLHSGPPGDVGIWYENGERCMPDECGETVPFCGGAPDEKPCP